MGKGNQAKAAMKRERNAEKNKASAGSQLKVNEAAKSIVCKICFQTFIVTASQKVLSEHKDSRHPDKDLVTCFPHLA